jgi:hypothetical protein
MVAAGWRLAVWRTAVDFEAARAKMVFGTVFTDSRRVLKVSRPAETVFDAVVCFREEHVVRRTCRIKAMGAVFAIWIDPHIWAAYARRRRICCQMRRDGAFRACENVSPAGAPMIESTFFA